MDGLIFAGLAAACVGLALFLNHREKNRKSNSVPPQTGGSDYYENGGGTGTGVGTGDGTGDSTTITKPSPDRPL